MTSLFGSGDRKLVVVVLLIMAASASYVWFNYEAAFPQASLSLALSRGEVTRAAERFLGEQQLSTDGFRNLTLFDPDEEARLYLERELGLTQANKLMQGEVPVWRWRARWFKPPEKEELIVHLRPDGRLIAYEHRVVETDPGARLNAAAARAVAESFLRAQTSQPHKLIAEQREARPNRDDHLFTWEQENFKAKDATLRRTLVVQGARVGSYREFLYVPEQWQRDFATLRSSNELYAGVAQALYAGLAVASLGLLILGLRRRRISWAPLVNIAAVVALFNFANELNTLPFAIDGMQTAMPYTQMILLALLGAVGAAVGVLLYVLLPAVAGSALFTRMFGNLPPLESAFTRLGIGTRSFFRASMVGFGFAAAHLAFLTAFYLVGAKVGVWSPSEVSYSDVLATPVPWIYPVAIALMASSAEEFWFRLLAVPLMLRLVGIRWIAVVAPAFVWGFLHATYPQQPGWIRGVEVGLIGVAAGYVMLRFGIVATLVWHYVIDAFLIGMFLFQAHSWSYRLHGLILAAAILAPLILSFVLYRSNGGFVAEIEAPIPVAEPHTEVDKEPLADPLPAPWPISYLWLAAGVMAIAAVMLRPVMFGDFVQVKIPREQAIAHAESELRRRNLEPSEWRMMADFAPNLRLTEFEYLRQQAGAAKANQIARDHAAFGIWRVRFFKPLNPEELIYYIDQENRLYRFDHLLDEKAAGGQPERDDAELAAVAALSRQGIDGYNLVDSQTDKLDHRTDHTFVWEDPAFQAGDGRFRVAMKLVGGEPCEFRRFFKLPEQWLRDFQKPTLAAYVLPAFFGSTVVPLILLFFRRMGVAGHRFHWRVYIWIACGAFLLTLIGEANDWPTLYQAYDTSVPMNSYLGQVSIALLSKLLLTAAAAFGSAMAADTFVQVISPGHRLPAFSWQRAIAVAILAGAAAQLIEWILQQMPGPRARLPLWGIDGMDSFLPAIAAIRDKLSAAFVATVAGTVYVCGGLSMIERKRLGIAVGALVVVGAVGRTLTLQQAPFTLLASALAVGVVFVVVMTCATDLVSVASGIFLLLSAASAWTFFEQPLQFLKWNAGAVGVLALVAVAAAKVMMRRTR